MKYIYTALPLGILWLSFGLVEAFDLSLLSNFEYLNGTYIQTSVAGWYAIPYVLTAILLLFGSTILAVHKVVK